MFYLLRIYQDWIEENSVASSSQLQFNMYCVLNFCENSSIGFYGTGRVLVNL